MGKDEAIKKVRLYKALLKEYFDIDTVYLYGSCVHGSSHQDSDIDVAIVVNNLEGDYFSTVPLAWKIRHKVDNRIEPIIFEKGKDVSGFLSEIIKTGIEIKD